MRGGVRAEMTLAPPKRPDAYRHSRPVNRFVFSFAAAIALSQFVSNHASHSDSVRNPFPAVTFFATILGFRTLAGFAFIVSIFRTPRF